MEKRIDEQTKDAIVEEREKLIDYDRSLRGPPQNRFGGHRTQRVRGLRGGTYGPAGPCYTYSDKERMAFEERLRRKGML